LDVSSDLAPDAAVVPITVSIFLQLLTLVVQWNTRAHFEEAQATIYQHFHAQKKTKQLVDEGEMAGHSRARH
jgi:phosphoribosyl-AMP cyclohydrolase